METMRTIAYICLALVAASTAFFGLQAMTHTNVAVRRRYLSGVAGGSAFLLVGMLYLFVIVPAIEKTLRTREDAIKQVFTAEVVTVKEKYISADGLLTDGDCFLVLTDGKETVRLKVTESIYNKYKVGDIYEHDADPKEYREH